jgi:hypothetical protein
MLRVERYPGDLSRLSAGCWRFQPRDHGLLAALRAIAKGSAGRVRCRVPQCRRPLRRPHSPFRAGIETRACSAAVPSPAATSSREGVGKVLGLVRDQIAGQLHDAYRVSGHAVIDDHALAYPQVAAAPDPQDSEVAFSHRACPSLRCCAQPGASPASACAADCDGDGDWNQRCGRPRTVSSPRPTD